MTGHKNRRYCSDLCKHRAGTARRTTERVERNRATWDEPITVDAATELDVAWLAGVIDGEGTIALTTSAAGNPTLRFHVYNTNRAIIQKTRSVLDRIGVEYYERCDDRNGRTPCSNISFGMDVALRLHPVLRPHLVRQVDRYDDAVALLGPRYRAGRQRVSWSADELAQWEALRRKHNRR